MAVFAPGARVLIRDEEWVVRKTDKGMVHVRGLSELVRGKDAIFLGELDKISELRPEETDLVPDDSPRFRRSRLYLESLLRRTPPPAGDRRIYLGDRAAIDPREYQMVPAAKALAQPQARILMADGVGLGKTIQVGILLTELIERHRADRILVVAVKSILAQFQEELWSRFTIPLVRLDSVGIQRVQSRIPTNMNPFHYYDRVIISIDTLKKDSKYRNYLEQCDWDVIVIDECQNVAVRTKGKGSSQHSQRARLARLLADRCDSLIMTSATPHDGSSRSFASLVNLLEPTAIVDEEDYTSEEVQDYFIRRSKKDIEHEAGVADSFRDRELDPHSIKASPPEEEAFRLLKGLEFETIARMRNSKGILFRTTLLKAYLSSPAACLETVNKRLDHKDMQDETDPKVAHDRGVLGELGQTLQAIGLEDFGKYTHLRNHLRTLGFDKQKNRHRIVVFSERIATLRFLRKNLEDDLGLKPEQITMFSGTLDDMAQQEIIDSFGRGDSPIRILLASDAAAEGLNLHWHCHRMIHFDLPWSLITLEQRNGRIDRYGQKHAPILTYLLTIPNDPDLRGDLRILDRLIKKEDAAHKNLGDTAWLMNLHDAEREEEAIARSIEDKASPEATIPDEPQGDLLHILMGSGEASRGITVERTTDSSLYPDDLSYCREALTAIVEAQHGDLEDVVEFHDHLAGFTLRAPEDLERRLDYLPPELRQEKSGRHTVFKLSQDRQRVMESLEASRAVRGRWPEWQLLWEQHPVCEWLDDSVVANFERHEAPILALSQGLDKAEAVVLFQGVITNNGGRAAVVDWFGVSFHGDTATDIRPLSSLLEATGLDRDPANPGIERSKAEAQRLKELLPTAVEKAKAHMRDRRLARMQELSKPIREGHARLKQWREGRLAGIADQRETATADGKTLPAPRRKALDELERQTERTWRRRQDTIERLKTDKSAYLRVAAVLIPGR